MKWGIMTSVELSGIYKSYGDVEVIHGIDLTIEDGEFVVLLGPSGCGKSTLLRMIAGLEKITDGEIRIGERVVNDLHPKDRNIAMVFQNYALYALMNVFDNMSFSLRLKKLPKDEIKKKVDWAANILGLEDYLHRYPRELSGGQRQRVAMGRAIVRDPEAFLFDEPLSNLDAKLRVQMRTEIRALHLRLKTTTIFVTHDQIEAMTMADKIVVMRDGIIEQIGAPMEVYDRPANLFVAEFMGSPGMNMLQGTVGSAAGKPVLNVDGDIALPLPHRDNLGDGRILIYGVRPEHFSVHGDGAEFAIEVVEPTGPDVQVYGTIGGTKVCGLFKELNDFRHGETVRLVPDIDRVRLFDPETGQAV